MKFKNILLGFSLLILIFLFLIGGCLNPCRKYGGDEDGDTICNYNDNCPKIANTDQADSDQDNAGDLCDNCPGIINSAQADNDKDGLGDLCDDDDDNDGILDTEDNCKFIANSSQLDTDQDKIGDICDFYKDGTPEQSNLGGKIGQTAPNFTLPVYNIEGDTEISLYDYYGFVILINIVTGWCKYCNEETPYLEDDVYQTYKDDGFIILQVAFEDYYGNPSSQEFIEAWDRYFGVTFPVLSDSENIVFPIYTIENAIPLSVILDRDMKIVNKIEGYYPDKIEGTLHELLD